MKFDMSGAGSVLGAIRALAGMKAPVNVIGVIPTCENMPGGRATRPGDIVTTLSGQTVEILNTDAEGRLILCDALTYAARFNPEKVVDIATLTGACVVALGKTCSAFFTADDRLAKRFESAAADGGEQFWRLPLLEELREQLQSDIADLKHTGDRWGGAISAALFLREFVGEVPWIHCDIAGPPLGDRAKGIYPKGGTGHAVLSFLSFIEAAGT
jgi:leucyl aminopeptidase